MIIVAFVMLFFQTISEIIKNIAILTGAASPDIIEQHAGHDALAEAE